MKTTNSRHQIIGSIVSSLLSLENVRSCLCMAELVDHYVRTSESSQIFLKLQITRGKTSWSLRRSKKRGWLYQCWFWYNLSLCCVVLYSTESSINSPASLLVPYWALDEFLPSKSKWSRTQELQVQPQQCKTIRMACKKVKLDGKTWECCLSVHYFGYSNLKKTFRSGTQIVLLSFEISR